MTEDSLRKLSLGELLDLLMQSTKELVGYSHNQSKTEYESKRQEVELLQRIIVEKQAEFRPGHSL
jgi:hypothetical protein